MLEPSVPLQVSGRLVAPGRATGLLIALIISRSTPPLNEQDAVVIAVLCAVLQPILIAVQWPSPSFPVLACRALYARLGRERTVLCVDARRAGCDPEAAKWKLPCTCPLNA